MRSRFLFVAVLLCAAAARADFIDLYANKLDMPQNKGPRLGRSKVVVIPVQIDAPGFSPVDMNRLHDFFETGASGGLTFTSYFEIASSNKYQPIATVAPLVRYQGCPLMIHSADCTIARGNVSALSQGMDFVRDVFRRAHEEGGVDFRAFDANGLRGEADGVIDGAIIVVNVPGVGVALPIEYVNGGANLSGGTGGPLVLDGVKIPYCAVGGASFPDGKQHLEYIILREYGHTLGFADLDYQHPMAGDRWPAWSGLHFSLMGDYDFSDRPVLPDAETRRALGWQTQIVLSGTKTLTLAPAGEGGAALKLGTMSRSRQEYFLAEVRGPASTGVDTGIRDAKGNPTWGIALYHVDWSRGPLSATGGWTSRLIYCLDCDPYHPFVRNLESSGTFALVTDGVTGGPRAQKGAVTDEMVLWHGGAVGSIDNAPPLSEAFRYVATNYYDGTPSGIAIRDITVNADHSVTATFTAPEVANPCADVSCPALEQCVSTGSLAGNCTTMQESVPDAGVLPMVRPPTSGCESTGTSGIYAFVLMALAAAGALRLRKA
jgi:hypothetical protein